MPAPVVPETLVASVAGNAPANSRPRTESGISRLVLFVVLGILAAIAAVKSLERVHGNTTYFQLPQEVKEKFPPMGQPIPQDVLDLNARAEEIMAYKNTALSLSIVGLAVCGAFGLANGLSQKSVAKSSAGLFGGLILGAMFGIAAGCAEVFVGLLMARFQSLDPTLRTIAIHASAWAMLAIGTGIVVGLSDRRIVRVRGAVAACIAGGLVASFLYAPLAAVFFASEKSEQSIPTGTGNRIFWISLTVVLTAIAIFRAGSPNDGASRHITPSVT